MFGSATIPSLDISPPILEGRAPLKARDPSLIPAAPHGNGAAAGLARLRSATRFATAPIPRNLDPRGLRSRHKGSHRGSRVSDVELVARVAKPPRTDVTQGDDVSPWDKPRAYRDSRIDPCHLTLARNAETCPEACLVDRSYLLEHHRRRPSQPYGRRKENVRRHPPSHSLRERPYFIALSKHPSLRNFPYREQGHIVHEKPPHLNWGECCDRASQRLRFVSPRQHLLRVRRRVRQHLG